MYVNPIQPAANSFLIIWESLPLPFRALFYISLLLIVFYAIFSYLKG